MTLWLSTVKLNTAVADVGTALRSLIILQVKAIGLPSVAILLSLLLAFAPATALAGNSVSIPSNDHLSLGLNLAARKYPEDAAGQFAQCTDLTAATPHQLSIIAQTYFEVGKTSSSMFVLSYALSKEKVKRDRVEMVHMLDLRGDVLSSLSRPDEAISSYELAAKNGPESAYLFLHKVGQELIKSKKYKEALPYLNKSVKKGVMNGFVYRDIGRCYLALNAPAEAIQPLRTSIDNFTAYRKRVKDAYMKAMLQTYGLLIKAYDATGNKKEALVWQKRKDDLVGDLNLDLFGEH